MSQHEKTTTRIVAPTIKEMVDADEAEEFGAKYRITPNWHAIIFWPLYALGWIVGVSVLIWFWVSLYDYSYRCKAERIRSAGEHPRGVYLREVETDLKDCGKGQNR